MAALFPDSHDAHLVNLGLYGNASMMGREEKEGLILSRPALLPPRAEAPGGSTESDGLEFLSLPRDEFSRALREMRGELAPGNWIERLLVDQISRSAWQLRAVAEAERKGIAGNASTDLADVAGRSLTQAIDQLRRLREASPSNIKPCKTMVSDHRGWQRDSRQVPNAQTSDPDPSDEVIEEAESVSSYSWRTRLTHDESVKGSTPVVRGTQISVGRVISLIVDGRSWSQILAQHPELTEADIRACIDYTLDQDGSLVLG